MEKQYLLSPFTDRDFCIIEKEQPGDSGKKNIRPPVVSSIVVRTSIHGVFPLSPLIGTRQWG